MKVKKSKTRENVLDSEISQHRINSAARFREISQKKCNTYFMKSSFYFSLQATFEVLKVN